MIVGRILCSESRDLWPHPEVDGVKVELQWHELEPQAGVINPGPLMEALDAVPRGKQVYLDILFGPYSPDYVQPRLDLFDHYPHMAQQPSKLSVPATWSKNYVRVQQRLWAALGNALEDQEHRVTAVNCSFVASIGSVLRFTPVSLDGKDPGLYLDQLRGADYSPDAVYEAWQEISKAVAYAFPLATLVIPVCPVEKDSFPSLDNDGREISVPLPLVHNIVGYASSYYPGRVMVTWEGEGDGTPPSLIRHELQGAGIGFAPKRGALAPEQATALFLQEDAFK